MARNYDRGGGPKKTSLELPNVETNEGISKKLDGLNKRPKWLVYSFIAVATIMIISFIIPNKYYSQDINILLLNIELIILFARDIFLYFKKSCNMIKTILVSLTGLYFINIIDMIITFPYISYLSLSIALIVIALGSIHLFGNKE